MINPSKAERIDISLHLQITIKTSLFFLFSLENNWANYFNSNKTNVSNFGNLTIYLKR